MAIQVAGQLKIASTGVAQQLPTFAALVNGIVLTAYSGNANPVVVGNSQVTNVIDGTGNGYILEAGTSTGVAIAQNTFSYVIGTANDVVSFIGS